MLEDAVSVAISISSEYAGNIFNEADFKTLNKSGLFDETVNNEIDINDFYIIHKQYIMLKDLLSDYLQSLNTVNKRFYFHSSNKISWPT